MSILTLGIDTSNYTTSAALCRDGQIIGNYKLPVTVKDGERGIRQSDAVFSHVKNLPALMKQVGKQELDGVGVSSRPRAVDGSYMPCFLVGVTVATAISEVDGIPLCSFSHQQGHLMAALYSAGVPNLWNKRFLAFHVSGGTTEMLISDQGKIEKIGGTIDLNAGQAIDRIGVLLGLKFPCGRELEQISADFSSVNCYSHVRGLECNLSGLENKAAELIASGAVPSVVAAFTLKSVLRTLDKLTENAKNAYGDLPVLFAGGVMSNRLIRWELERKYHAFFAEPEFSCDNAAGVALLCYRQISESRKGANENAL